MPLNDGACLGPYEVLNLPGAGGMGEVYRARDSQLRREVALKILPERFAADPDRRARFTREARVLASLNHPNIAAIYGIEESEGPTARGRRLETRTAGNARRTMAAPSRAIRSAWISATTKFVSSGSSRRFFTA